MLVDWLGLSTKNNWLRYGEDNVLAYLLLSPQTHLEIVLLNICGFNTTGMAGKYRFTLINVGTPTLAVVSCLAAASPRCNATSIPPSGTKEHINTQSQYDMTHIVNIVHMKCANLTYKVFVEMYNGNSALYGRLVDVNGDYIWYCSRHWYKVWGLYKKN